MILYFVSMSKLARTYRGFLTGDPLMMGLLGI